jgi:RimJ/RimL family protein N-acetyltransferase
MIGGTCVFAGPDPVPPFVKAAQQQVEADGSLASGEKMTRINCKTVSLRAARLSDRRTAFEWLTQSDATSSMMGEPRYPDHPLPSWDEFQKDYSEAFFDERGDGKGRNFIIMLGGGEIGTIGYDNLDRQKRSVDLDIWMKEERYCGHGYGPDALEGLIDHLHGEYGITTFRVDPSARNERAIRAFMKAGFRIEHGRISDRPPDYDDGISMMREISPNQAIQPAGKVDG